ERRGAHPGSLPLGPTSLGREHGPGSAAALRRAPAAAARDGGDPGLADEHARLILPQTWTFSPMGSDLGFDRTLPTQGCPCLCTIRPADECGRPASSPPPPRASRPPLPLSPHHRVGPAPVS